MRCDICGKFRKPADLVGIMGEHDEEWTECIKCMSPVDRERYFTGGGDRRTIEIEVEEEE